MRSVFLVGTDHRYQRGAALGVREEVFAEFRAELQRHIEQHAVKGIAEEMSLDGMGIHRSVGGSLGFHIARDLGIPHLYCDPSRQEQHDRGIGSSEERERYWLDQIRTFSGFPCLFILGADHVPTFSALLHQSGFRGTVLVHDWKPQCREEV
jgi:hypothetical protein